LSQGLQERPAAAVGEFKTYLLAGLAAWLLQMIVFAPLFYYSSVFLMQRLLPAKERKISL
jgi:hypothetical protein